MNGQSLKFDSEEKMVRFGRREIRQLTEGLGVKVAIKSEVVGVGSIPDLVMFVKDNKKVSYVVSIEFKLSNWRKALAQAFAQKNFSNEAYVVLDHRSAGSALANIDRFINANVGLATVDRENGLRVWSYCDPSLPFSEHYSELFSQKLLKRKTKPVGLPYTRSIKGGVKLSGIRFLTKGKVG